MNEQSKVGWVIQIFMQKDNMQKGVQWFPLLVNMVSEESISSKIRNVNVLIFLHNNHVI